MLNREQFIQSLVDELESKPRRLPLLWVAILWWFLCWVYVTLATLAVGPLRACVAHELTHSHQFQLESILVL